MMESPKQFPVDGKKQSRELQCTRCKRIVHNFKYFHFRKNLCIYCYNILYESYPCFDCFQQVETKRETPQGKNHVKNGGGGERETIHLCHVCRSQRLQMKHTTCSRTSFHCSKCASVHMLRCPLVHSTDMNLPSHVHRMRQQNITEYRSSNAVTIQNGELTNDGFYFWHKFLFCSHKCVQKQFATTPLCVLCGRKSTEETDDRKRCHRCRIPLCIGCASKWFIRETDFQESSSEHMSCIQCFIDLHPTWTQNEIHKKVVQCLAVNYPQILNNSLLDDSVRWIILEYLVKR